MTATPVASEFSGDETGAYELPAEVRRDAAAPPTSPTPRLLLEACGLASYQHGKFRTYFYGRRP